MKDKEEKGHTVHHSAKSAAIDRALNGAIAVLFIIALVLGYAIYVQRRPPQGTPPAPTGPVERKSASESGQGQESYASQLTDAQKAVLVVPDANASEADRQAYFDRVDKASKEATEIVVTKCFSDPMVLKTKNEDCF